jgi:hypothetical protein
MFEGATMGKGRLVLALVKRYVHDRPFVKFEDLYAAFPDKLQADSPVQFDKVRCVVSRLRDIPEASRDRFFSAEEDRIHLGDDTVAVSREWNVHNIQKVLALAESLGYRIAVVPQTNGDAGGPA